MLTDTQMVIKIYRHAVLSQDTLHQPAKLQLCIPYQSKVMLTEVNSTDYPLAGLECTLEYYSVSDHTHTSSCFIKT